MKCQFHVEYPPTILGLWKEVLWIDHLCIVLQMLPPYCSLPSVLLLFSSHYVNRNIGNYKPVLIYARDRHSWAG